MSHFGNVVLINFFGYVIKHFMLNIVSRKTIERAKRDYPNAAKALDVWYDFVKHSNWNGPDDIKQQFGSVSFLSGNRVIFNIKGNSYRLLVGINYPGKQVFIKWFGTHAEYDKKKF